MLVIKMTTETISTIITTHNTAPILLTIITTMMISQKQLADSLHIPGRKSPVQTGWLSSVNGL